MYIQALLDFDQVISNAVKFKGKGRVDAKIFQMPKMYRLDADKRIRGRWHHRPKIIAITAYALDGDMDMCIKAGMDDYLSNPIQLNYLQNKLIKWGSNKEDISKT